MKKCRYLIVFSLACVLLLCSCSRGFKKENTKTEDKFELYYLNKQEDKLIGTDYSIKGGTKEEQVQEVLQEMRKVSKKINCINAIPQNVSLLEFNVSGNTITLNFSVEYQNMSSTREIMCRAATVLTLTQIEGIDYVVIECVGVPLTNSNGKTIEPLKESDFMESDGELISNYQEVEMTLYYGSIDGNALVEQHVLKTYEKNIPQERFIMENLINGSGENEMLRTVPENTKILSITTQDGVCYVNLDSSFLTEPVPVTSEVEIYSIVNSLCELDSVNKVQFSFNGQTGMILRNSINLSGVFTRNLDMVVERKD